MKQEKDIWEELIRTGLGPYNVSLCLSSIKYSNEFLGGPKYEKLLIYVKDDITYYYENFKDHDRVGKYCLNLFLKDEKLFDKHTKFWDQEFKKVKKIFQKIRKTDINKLSKLELVNLLENLFNTSVYWHGTAYNIDAIDETLNPLIKEIIQKAYPQKTESERSLIYNKLTYPSVLSYINRMDLEKLKLFLLIHENGIKENQEKINQFIEKYYWINFEWGKSPEYTEKKFLKEHYQKNPKKIKIESAKLQEQFRKKIEDKEEIIKKISQNFPIIKNYIDIFNQYAIFHDLRKEGQVTAVHYIRKIYKALGEKLGISNNLIYCFWPDELIETVKKNKKINLELLEKRKNGWFCEYHHTGKKLEKFGKQALIERDKAIESSFEDQQKELSGIGTSAGRVIGKARIVLSAAEALKKISEGDVLVTGMTMPEFIPAMKRARAVVTDEGGLTCHAAIISRELGIPCVAGTKMATRVIKDGDKIEVNANHGIIKILEK